MPQLFCLEHGQRRWCPEPFRGRRKINPKALEVPKATKASYMPGHGVNHQRR